MRRRRLIAAGTLAAIVAAACSTPPTTAPTNTPSGFPTAGASGVPTQSETAWGRIWDALPAGFPMLPGARPAVGVAESASASFDIEPDGATGGVGGGAAGGAAGLADFYATALSAGYVVSREGPLEDGAFEVDAARPGGQCRIRVRAAPLGSLIRLTILYGAACPLA